MLRNEASVCYEIVRYTKNDRSSVKDITGRTVLLPVVDHVQYPVIDCSMLQKGIYLLELIYLNHATETFKINLIK